MGGARFTSAWPTLSEVAVNLDATREQVVEAAKLRDITLINGRINSHDVGSIYFGLRELRGVGYLRGSNYQASPDENELS